MDKYTNGLRLALEALKLALSLVVEKVPDAAAIIERTISGIEAALASGDVLTMLRALQVPRELLDIAQLHFDPHNHPSDGA
jgi:hypothetical protein